MTIAELVDCLFDLVSTGDCKTSDQVPAQVLDKIYRGHVDALEYLADKIDIKGGL